jgi:hypothetical protein
MDKRLQVALGVLAHEPASGCAAVTAGRQLAAAAFATVLLELSTRETCCFMYCCVQAKRWICVLRALQANSQLSQGARLACWDF